MSDVHSIGGRLSLDREPLYTVGVIIGTHGLKGDVKVFSRTDFPELRFVKGSKLLLVTPAENVIPVEVKSARLQGRVFVVSFFQFSTIDEVEKLRGSELKVPESELAPLPSGHYFIHELVGCEVYDDQNRRLGILHEVLTPGANDVYVVRTNEGKDLLFPAIPECILRVDVQNKRINVHVMPGLLD